MKRLIFAIGTLLTVGCDLHFDSVYLGRSESKFLGDVGKGDLKAVKAYLDKGGNVNLQDEPGMTPLHYAVNGNWDLGNFDTIKLLIDKGANVNATDDTHYTPLHMCNNAEVAELLIDHGANVNARTRRSGETPLFSATHGAAQGASKSYQKYLRLTEMLLARGADVSVKLKSGSMLGYDEPHREKTGDTVLHGVVRSYSEEHAIEVSELLMAHGANINVRNIIGNTPLDDALLNKRSKTAKYIREHGGKTADELNAKVR